MSSHHAPFAVLLAALLLAIAPLSAQCTSSWQAGDPLATPSGLVVATHVWDADGPGGNPALLVAGGSMNLGSAQFTGVYTYNGSVWAPLGSGVGTAVAFTTWNNQLLVALQNPGLPVTTSIRAWNGSSWQTFGSVSGTVAAMVVYQNQPYIGGAFSSVSGVAANSIARWTNGVWSAVGTGTTGSVRAMAVFNGALRVGGQFSNAGGLVVGNLAYWNGTNWIGGPNFNGSIDAMFVRESFVVAQNYLFVGGSFTSINVSTPIAAARVARLDTANAWTPVGTGVPGTRCLAIAVRDAGFGYEIIAGLDDPASTSDAWRYYAGVWSALGPTSALGHPVYAVMDYGQWLIGRSGNPAVMTWNGTTWNGLVGQGIGGTVRAIEPRDGGVVIGGAFTKADGVTVNGIAQGGSNNWTPLGTGMTGGSGVYALATATNGDVIAGGDFNTAGGVACSRVARWNGAAWSPMGTGLDGIVRALLVLPTGEIVAAGDFVATANHVAWWNGASWQPIGAGLDGSVHALALLPTGRIVAGGEFIVSGGVTVNRIAMWDGAGFQWQPLNSGFNDAVFALAVGPDGTLHAGGRFTATGVQGCRVARWAGGIWSPTPVLGVNTDVLALGVHPNGELFVGGGVFSFNPPLGGGYSSNLLRVPHAGVQSTMAVTGTFVRDIAFPQGDIAIGGTFEQVAASLSVNYATYDAPCAAQATDFGVGCAGSAGVLVQQALEAPWLGAALRLRTTTFAPGASGLQVLGYGTMSLSLPLVLPEALLGCIGFVTPDDLQIGNVVAGAMTWSLTVPYQLSLVGATLHAQAVQVELNGAGFSISTSNATTVTIGVL